MMMVQENGGHDARRHCRRPVLTAHTPPDAFAGSTETLAPNGDYSEPDRLLALALASLEDDKADDVVTIDLRGKTAIFDYMVVASGRSTRHVATIAEKLMQRIKDDSTVAPRAEGLSSADWVLIDGRDVIVHVFRPEVREFYNIERMWTGPAAENA